MKISGLILGVLPSMKNSRQIVRNRRTGKPMVIKSEKARAFEEHALSQLGHKRPPKSITSFVRLIASVYYDSRRHDLDIELFCDVLQAAKIIANDRQIVEKHSRYYLDRDNPRIEFSIEEIEWEF